MVAVLVSLAVLMLFGQLSSVRPQTSSVGEQSNATFIGAAREFLLTHQNQTGLDSTVMISMLDTVDHVSIGYQNWNSTYGDFYLQMWYWVPDPNNPGPGTVALLWLGNYHDGPWINIVIENGLLELLQDFREGGNASKAQMNVTKERAVSIATDYIKNYSYIAQDGSLVSGFSFSQNLTTASLLNNTRGGLLSPCWVVIFTLNQTYPDGVNQLFVEVWPDTGEIFAIGNLAPTHLITIDNPYPTPTPTPTPTSTPSTSPSPSPTSSPSPSASSSPSPSPSQTPNPTATPNPTINPSPSQTLPPSQEPTSSPTQNQPIPPEALYAIAIVAAIIAVTAVAFVLRRRPSKQETTQLDGASE